MSFGSAILTASNGVSDGEDGQTSALQLIRSKLSFSVGIVLASDFTITVGSSLGWDSSHGDDS